MSVWTLLSHSSSKLEVEFPTKFNHWSLVALILKSHSLKIFRMIGWFDISWVMATVQKKNDKKIYAGLFLHYMMKKQLSQFHSKKYHQHVLLVVMHIFMKRRKRKYLRQDGLLYNETLQQIFMPKTEKNKCKKAYLNTVNSRCKEQNSSERQLV